MAGCSFGPPREPISDQFNPAGACWSVDLSDGLDDQGTDELHHLFDCLNRTGNLSSFEGLDEAFDEEDRSGQAVGLTLVKMGKMLPSSPFDVLGMVGRVLELLRDHRDQVVLGMEMVVEGIYARPYGTIVEDFDLDDPDALDEGLAKPAIQLAAQLATVMLDEGPQLREDLVESLDSDLVQNASCTFTTAMETDDPTVESIVEDLIPHLADAWTRAAEDSNNHWEGATGNSLRDMVDHVQDRFDTGALSVLEPPILTLLSDTRVQEHTKQVLSDTVEAGHIESLPTQVLYLASVDVNGRPLSEPGADDISALQAGLRLLHRSNQPLSCDLLLIEFNLDNMAVTMLKELAEMDAGEVDDSLGFFVDILDGDFAPYLLETAAEEGLCAGFTPELLSDLTVLERLNDPEVGNLVEVILGMLDAVYQPGQVDRVAEMVDILAVLHTEAMVPPLEELLRDLVDSPLMGDITAVLPTVFEPERMGAHSCEDGAEPLHFDQVWITARDTLAEPDSDDSAFTQLIEHTFRSEELWTMIDRGARLGQEPDALMHEMPPLLLELLTDQEAQDTSQMLEDILNDPEIWKGTLTIVESTAMRDAMLAHSDDVSGPLPFIARLVVSDTVTVMLQTLDLVLDSLGGTNTENP